MKKLAVLVLTVLTAALSLCGCSSRTEAPAADKTDSTEMGEPVLFEKGSFQNIMGYDGYWEEERTHSKHHIRRYYTEENGSPVLIACSWFWRSDPADTVEDYVLDIDGDGVTELVCNTVTGGSTHLEVYIYRRTANGVERGEIDREKTNIPDFDDWGTNASSSRYDAQTERFLLSYSVKDSKNYKEIAVSLDAFTFEPLGELNNPS